MSRPLTPRQMEVARAVLKGMSEPEIAAELGMCRRTVKVHLVDIYKSLDIDRRWNKKLRMVYLLWQNGMIEELSKGNPCIIS